MHKVWNHPAVPKAAYRAESWTDINIAPRAAGVAAAASNEYAVVDDGLPASWSILAGAAGFEPATSAFQRRRSARLSYTPVGLLQQDPFPTLGTESNRRVVVTVHVHGDS